MPVPNHSYYRVIPVEVVDKHEDLDVGGDKPPLHPLYASSQMDGLTTRDDFFPSRNNNNNINSRKISCPLLTGGYHRSRERTRQSAVQRLVERKLAQKEKEREKERDRSLGGGGRSSRLDTFFSRNSCSPSRLRETSCSRSENGYMLGAGRAQSPSKENLDPDWLSGVRYARSASGSRLRGHSEEPIAKTYITIGPGKPTRIREHSPAKSAKLSRDENLSESRERLARSRNSSPFRSHDLNRHSSSSPLRKTSRTISPTRSKELLRTASPLKTTDVFKTVRASNIEPTTCNTASNDPNLNQKSTPFFTEKVFKINQVNSNISASSSSLDSAATSSRRPSVDILNNNDIGQRLNKRASPDSEFTSASSLSSQASSLNSSAESVVSSASQRRISLEQRFQRRTSTAKFTSPNLTGVASVDEAEAVTAANTVDEDGWTHIKIRRVSTTKTHCQFSSTTAGDSRSSVTPPRLPSNGPPAVERPVPASRKISLPQGIAARKPYPAPRRRSLTNILAPERLADERKEEGNQLYKQKNYREALQKYSEAIDLCPQSASFYGNRSACYLMLGQPRQALDDSKTATSLDPLFVKGWSRLAKCSIMIGDAVTARQAMQRAGVEDQTDKRNLEALERFKEETMNSVNSKDYRRALYCLDKCLEISTHSLPLKALRAECLAFLGRYAEAQEAANGVLTLDNMNADAIYVRGLCLYYEDNVDRAFSHFQQVLRFAPDHTKAKEAYKKARQLKMKKEEGNNAFKAGQFDSACNLYSEALAIDPFNRTTNSKLYFNRATVQAKLGKLQQTIDDCTKAIDLDSNYIKAYLRRGKTYLDTEQYEEAVRDYEHVHKSDKSNREYRQLLQNAKLELRKSKRKDYYKILAIDKNANEEEIKKAYRKRAMVHHPDRHSGATEQEKKDHETKFKEVGEAYAILSDEKKKRAYDSGQDLDDMGGCHAGHDIDPNTIFQAFFGGGGGGMGGMGGPGGAQHFSFGPGGGQSFSFQFG